MTIPPVAAESAGTVLVAAQEAGLFAPALPRTSRAVRSRVALMNYPLYEFEAVYNGLTSSASTFRRAWRFEPAEPDGLFPAAAGPVRQLSSTRDPDDTTVTGQAFATGDGTTTAFTIDRALGGFLEPVGWVTTLSKVYLNGARAIGRLYADDAEHFDLHGGAGRRRHGLRRLLLRVQVPLSRRPDGVRGVHVEPVEARQHEIPQREAMKPAPTALIPISTRRAPAPTRSC